MSEPTRHSARERRWSLHLGLGWWFAVLVLGLIQARAEAVRFTTPYGLLYLRSLLIPVAALLVFYLLALRTGSASRGPRTLDQVFFLLLVLILTYWGATAPLRPNWLLLLGVWGLIPSLYLGKRGLIAQTTLLSLGSFILTVVLVELLMHPFPRLWPGYARMVGSNWRRLHADIPTLEYEAKGIEYRINELGFRGPGPVPGMVEIVALGDSFTFGVGTQHPWPEQVAAILDATVLNLGMGGTDPPKFVNPLLAFGLPRQPRYVIAAYFEGNDLYTCYQPARPSGRRWGDTLILPDLVGGVSQMLRYLQAGDAPTSVLSFDIATPFTRQINGEQVVLTFSPAYTATLLLDRAAIEQSENFRIARSSLLELQRQSEAAGSTFILVYIPERAHVYWPLIREDEALLEQLNQDMDYAWKEQLGCLSLARGRVPPDAEGLRQELDASLDDQRRLISELAAANDIPLLDATDELQALAAQGVTLADPLETHYNDSVNAVLAQAIADFIREDNLP
jgi:hypothetical protein